jgi:hypothetical protein
MPTARVELYFELGGGVYVARELLGQVLTVDRDGENVAIEFPSGPADFAAGRGRDELPAIWGASRGTVEDPDQLVTVRVLRVVIRGDLSFAPTTYRSEDREQLDEAARLFRHAHELGSSAIQDFRDWIRVTRLQPWLGVTGEPVEITGLQQLFDEETGDRYPIGFPYTLHGYLRDDASALQAGDVAQIEASLSGRARPGLADLLLADAAAVLAAGRDHGLSARRPRRRLPPVGLWPLRSIGPRPRLRGRARCGHRDHDMTVVSLDFVNAAITILTVAFLDVRHGVWRPKT